MTRRLQQPSPSFDPTRPGTWTRKHRVEKLRELATYIVDALSHRGIMSDDVYRQSLIDADMAAEDLRQLIEHFIGPP